jgi:SAM-dependent methyltransferase
VIQPSAIPDNYRCFIRGDARRLEEIVGKRYDTVIALEVMEHIPDYIVFIRSCHEILSPGGLLVLSVPNPLYWTTVVANIIWPKGKSGAAEMDGKILNDPYYGHINFFFPRLLNRVAEEVGFDLVTMRYLSKGIRTPLTAVINFYVYRKR